MKACIGKRRVFFLTVIFFAVGYIGWGIVSKKLNENNPLAQAINKGDAKQAATLLQNGADPNRLATIKGEKVRSEFLDGVADALPWARSTVALFDYPQRESLLWLATERNQAEIVRELLRHGANVDKVGNDKSTALMHAAYRGNANIVQMLLIAGADPNRRGWGGNTPAIYGASNPSVSGRPGEDQFADGMRVLIAAGADVNAQGSHGYTAFAVAESTRRYDVMIMLQKAPKRH